MKNLFLLLLHFASASLYAYTPFDGVYHTNVAITTHYTDVTFYDPYQGSKSIRIQEKHHTNSASVVQVVANHGSLVVLRETAYNSAAPYVYGAIHVLVYDPSLGNWQVFRREYDSQSSTQQVEVHTLSVPEVSDKGVVAWNVRHYATPLRAGDLKVKGSYVIYDVESHEFKHSDVDYVSAPAGSQVMGLGVTENIVVYGLKLNSVYYNLRLAFFDPIVGEWRVKDFDQQYIKPNSGFVIGSGFVTITNYEGLYNQDYTYSHIYSYWVKGNQPASKAFFTIDRFEVNGVEFDFVTDASYLAQSVSYQNENGVAVVGLSPSDRTFYVVGNSAHNPTIDVTQTISGSGGTSDQFSLLDDGESAYFANLSSRSFKKNGAGYVVNGGIIVEGNGPKTVLALASGPRLSHLGVPSALQNPYLTLSKLGVGEIARNYDWEQQAAPAALSNGLVTYQEDHDLVAALLEASGIDTGTLSLDGAMLVTLDPGPYVFKVFAEAGSNQEGNTMISLWEVGSTAGDSRIVNLSSRGYLELGQVFNGGLIIEGSTPKKVLALASGPRLSYLGVSDTLENPLLELKRLGVGQIAVNYNWQSQIAPSLGSNGLIAYETNVGAISSLLEARSISTNQMTLDAVMVVTLEPGAYVFRILGESGTSQDGNTMISLWEIDE